MGNLEKAGVLVVVVLLAVIMVVAFVSDPGDATDPGSSGKVETASRQGDPEVRVVPPRLQRPQPVDEERLPGGARGERLDDGIVDVTPVGGEGRPVVDIESGGGVAPDDGGGSPVAPRPPLNVGGGEAARGEETADGFPREVKVQAGDSLWRIAARNYGVRSADAMALAIQEENDINDPLALREGMPLVLPAPDPKLASAAASDAAEAGRGAPSSAGGLLPFDPGPVVAASPARPAGATGGPESGDAATTYVVRSGDTLGDIAVATLGSTKFVKKIMDLNDISDARKIRPGMVLNLPSRAR